MKKKPIPKRYVFFALVGIIYLVLYLVNPPFIREAIINTFSLIYKILPVIGIVFVVMVLVNLYVHSGKIKKHLGESSGLKGWIYSIISGILISGPPYILFPLLGDLKKKGMKNSYIAAFLYNRNVKIPFIPVMIYYFGPEFTIITSAYIVIFSILNGKIMEMVVGDKQ